MASPPARLAALVRNGIFRPGPDATYADGDDTSWMGVDWPSLQRPLDLLTQPASPAGTRGRRVNLLDTQPASPAGTRGRRVNVLDTQPASPAGTGSGGSGPPLLFLHGWSSNWQVFLLNIAAFMETHRCLALDLPGFGHSDMPSEPISIQGYAKTVDAMCDALGVDRVSVVGNSMGGFIGAELALAFSTRVDRLVLVSAAGLDTEHLARGPSLALARAVATGFPRAHRFDDAIVRRRRLRRAAMQGVFRYPERVSVPLAHELVISAGRPGFVPALDALLSYAFRDRLGMIEIPVMIVWGRNDMLVPVGDAYRYQRLIGDNARVVVFEDTGHAPMLERPSRFNELLRQFLAGDPEPESEVAGASGPSATGA